MYVNKYKEYPNSCIVLYVPERDTIFEGNEDAMLRESDTTIGGESVLENERENVEERGEITDEERRENVLSSLTEGQRDVIRDVQTAFQDPNTDPDTLQGLMNDFIFDGPLYYTGYDIYERSILEEGNP